MSDQYTPTISWFDRPEISKTDFRRMRSIALNLAAFAEAHGAGPELLAQIHELRKIINATAGTHQPR